MSAATSAPSSVRCGDWLELRIAAAEPAPALDATRRGFWLMALVFVVVQAGGMLPIPLYVIWQPRYGFSAGMLTLIFAVYAVGTLLALLLISPISDQLGRRPMLSLAVVLGAASTGVFLIANSVAALLAARFLSGLAAGLVSATATAAPWAADSGQCTQPIRPRRRRRVLRLHTQRPLLLSRSILPRRLSP